MRLYGTIMATQQLECLPPCTICASTYALATSALPHRDGKLTLKFILHGLPW